MALPIILAQSVTSKGALKIENTTIWRGIFAHFLVKYGRNRKKSCLLVFELLFNAACRCRKVYYSGKVDPRSQIWTFLPMPDFA